MWYQKAAFHRALAIQLNQHPVPALGAPQKDWAQVLFLLGAAIIPTILWNDMHIQLLQRKRWPQPAATKTSRKFPLLTGKSSPEP